MQKLGSLIGRVKHAFTITNHADAKVSVSIWFDFTTATDDDLKSWLVSNRVIAFQRPTRGLSASEIRDLDGTVIVASNAGQKIKSRAERINELVAAFTSNGVDAATAKLLATAAVDNPATLAIVNETTTTTTE